MRSSVTIKKYIYMITLLFITLSGFGQMPIFKRYYIADIPGLGWLAQFYVLHIIHYVTAVVLIGFVCYIVMEYILRKADRTGLTRVGYAKVIILAGLVVSGVLMVFRNLPGVYLNHNFIILLNLSHLGLCMALLGVSFYGLVYKKRWVR